MDRSTEEPWPCNSSNYFTANVLPRVRYGASSRSWLSSPTAALLLPRCCDWEGMSVAGSLSPHSCSAVRAYARRSEPGRDTMLSLHALSSKRPSGGWVRRWTSATCQGEEGTQTKGRWEQQWEEEHVQERQKRKKGCPKWQKGREGRGQNTEGEKRPVVVPGAIFLSKKESKREREKKKG